MLMPLREKPEAETLPRFGAASALLNGHYAPPPKDEDGKIWARHSVLIQGEAQDLYERWHDIENAPMWQEEIESVTRTGAKTSHWVMKSGDKTIEWDSEVLADEPGKRIAWHSIGGESKNAGEVIFEPAPGGRGVIVTTLQEFTMGKIASLWETFVGRNPKQAVIENLRHFKQLAESGEIPRIHSPHGDRGISGKLKGAMYSEKLPTPPGTSLPVSEQVGPDGEV